MAGKFLRIAAVADIPPETAAGFVINGVDVAVCNVDGAFYAIHNVCTHADALLTDGDLEGAAIVCPRHGASFDVRTGAVLSMPAAFPVRTYETKVEGSDIFIKVDEDD
jgi:3-phenylpropionate/trans-cinnamate dioxygenase ferredoxin subunit